jgi:hypothetical protein
MDDLLKGGLVALAIGGLTEMVTYMGDDIDDPSDDNPIVSVPYSEFAEKAKTGDLLLISCPTSMTRMFTKSLWSHCGIVWRPRPHHGHGQMMMSTSTIYEWSSHRIGEQVMNSIGKPFNGTQFVPLDYLAADNGAIYWRPVSLTEEQRDRLYEFTDAMAYKVSFSEYPEFAAYLGSAAAEVFNGFGTGMVCSHTVAATYMSIDALALDRHLSQYSPETFSPTGDARWLVPVDEQVKMVVGFDTSRLVSLLQPKKIKKQH